MNSISKFAACVFALLLALAVSAPAWARANPRNAQGEEFFIVSSIDLQKRQLVLMRPTQLTLVATYNAQTEFLGEKGEKLAIKDFKAGQTVWAITRPGKDGEVTAIRLREGAMTAAELHKLYLSTPSSNSYTSMPPLSPLPQGLQNGVHAMPSPRPLPYTRRFGSHPQHPHRPGGNQTNP